MTQGHIFCRTADNHEDSDFDDKFNLQAKENGVLHAKQKYTAIPLSITGKTLSTVTSLER
jgi:hypothetical protein